MLLGNIKGQIEIIQRMILGELAVIKKVGSVSVNERAQRQAVLQSKMNDDAISTVTQLGTFHDMWKF